MAWQAHLDTIPGGVGEEDMMEIDDAVEAAQAGFEPRAVEGSTLVFYPSVSIGLQA
jgi:hypothetical protein